MLVNLAGNEHNSCTSPSRNSADTIALHVAIGHEPDNWYEYAADILEEKFAINMVVRVFPFINPIFRQLPPYISLLV